MTAPTKTAIRAEAPITPLDRPPRPATPGTRLVPPVGVIQPLPGIGDMVWHLPHIRAISAHAGVPVTVLTKPRSLADQLLAHEASVADVAWLDLNPAGRRGLHDGVFGFRRLVRDLRARRFGSIILLHHSDLLAAAAWMAGIPDRRGYGWGRQRWFLNTGPFLPPDVKRLHQHARATRYLAASAIDLPSPEPSIDVPASIRAAARQRFGTDGYVAIGVGSSEALKQWGPTRFSALAAALLDAGWSRLLLLGGADEQALVNRIITDQGARGAQVQAGLGWNLADVIAAVSGADLYIGNDTGVMNIAAATGVRAYALFGTIPPLRHASQIVAITAPDIGVHDGVARVTLDTVLQAIQADRGRLGP